MTRKATRPCLACGKRLPASQKRKVCSKTCRDELRIVLKAGRKGGKA